ncbi:MAG: hypothetical protein LKM31_12225 [Sphingobium sp.]|jgi:phosphoribosylanthranilate isomerase|nr:hypothetical protein [Sphingobium sp.]
MSRIAIKICGLSTPETLDAALKGGASHVGFVHFAKSPRHVDGDRLAQLAARVPGHVRKVGVVVNPDNAEIEMLVRVGDLDALQLHGSEAPERLAQIRARFPRLHLWKAAFRLPLAARSGGLDPDGRSISASSAGAMSPKR